jgi:hypothetical protein
MTSTQESFTGDAEKFLRITSSSSIFSANPQNGLRQISPAVQVRDQESLPKAVCTAVPEYRPGAWLSPQADLSCELSR